MCVEVVKSIALKPTRSRSGATVSVLAVSMPSAPHRLWLPSRSVVSTRPISATGALPRNTQQNLPLLDRRAVPDQDLDDGAANLGAHAVHELHHFDDADYGVLFEHGADLDVRRGAGSRGAVEDAEKRCGDVNERGVVRASQLWLGHGRFRRP